MKENFQKIAIELYKQPKKTKKHLKLIINTLRVDEVAKTDD